MTNEEMFKKVFAHSSTAFRINESRIIEEIRQVSMMEELVGLERTCEQFREFHAYLNIVVAQALASTLSDLFGCEKTADLFSSDKVFELIREAREDSTNG